PPIFNLPFTLEADLEIPAGGANGVIVAAGSRFGGMSFYLKDGKPVFHSAETQLPGYQSHLASDMTVPTGPAKLRFELSPDNLMTIFVNGVEVARGKIEHKARLMAGLGETFDTGRDTNVPVTDDYSDGGVFT